jgi:hypothetical protein
MRASAIRSWFTVLSLAISCGRITPLTSNSRSSLFTRICCRAATTRLPLGSTWVITPASRSATVSLRLILPVPPAVLALLADTRLAALTALPSSFGKLASRPSRFGTPMVSLPFLVSLEAFSTSAVSVVLTMIVTISPT